MFNKFRPNKEQTAPNQSSVKGSMVIPIANQKKETFFRSHKKLITIAAIFVIGITTITFGYILLKEKPRAAFTINGKHYSLADYQTAIGNPQNKKLAKDSAKNAYIEIAKMMYVADKLDIEVSTDKLDQTARAQYRISNYNSLTTVQQQFVYQIVLESVISSQQYGDFSGYVYVFPFDNKIPQDSAVEIPGAGDQAAIERDRQYAQAQADYYHQQLTSGALKNDDAIGLIKADRRLAYVNSFNDSVKFENSTLALWPQAIQKEDIMKFITSLKSTGISEIQTLQVKNTQTGQMTNGRYYFVNLLRAGKARVDLSSRYQKLLGSLKVKLYV